MGAILAEASDTQQDSLFAKQSVGWWVKKVGTSLLRPCSRNATASF
jgi:hypothetical protein